MKNPGLYNEDPDEKKSENLSTGDLFRGLKKRAMNRQQAPAAAKINISHLGRQPKNQVLHDQ